MDEKNVVLSLKEFTVWDTCPAQWVKHPTLVLGWGHNLRVVGSRPASGSSSLFFPLPLPLQPPPQKRIYNAIDIYGKAQITTK